jgi:predicted nucleic acid-binding protein
MNPVQEVCVDASIAVKVVVTAPDSDKAPMMSQMRLTAP